MPFRNFDKITNIITISIKCGPSKAVLHFLLSQYHVAHMHYINLDTILNRFVFVLCITKVTSCK